MFNPDSSSPAKSLSITDILLKANWQKAEAGIFATVFTPAFFAHDWDSIFVKPHQLPRKEIKDGMRMLTAPTLLLSSKGAKMAYVLASPESPVFISNEYDKDEQIGYTMAFRLGSFILPEYMYYLCVYDYWTNYISFGRKGSDPFERVGPMGDYDLDTDTYIEFPSEAVVSHLGNVVVPVLETQKRMIAEAKEQAQSINRMVEVSTKDLANIIERYLIVAGGKRIIHSTERIGLLREVYRLAAGTAVDNKVVDTLSPDLYRFYPNAIDQSDIRILANNFAKVFPMLVENDEFSWDGTPSYQQPKEVTDFMVEIANIPSGITVYNPFAGLASYAIALPNNNVVGEEINTMTWAVAQIRLFAYGIKADISNKDSFPELDSDTKYDAIISSPVYLTEKGRDITDIVTHLYNKLSDNGELICLVPHGFLNAQQRKSVELRERLLGDRTLKGVITLPNNIFAGMSIVQDILLIKKGTPSMHIIMADGSNATRYAKSSYRMTVFEGEQFLKDIEEDIVDYGERGEYVIEGDIAIPLSYDDVIGNNLTPAFYLTPKPLNGVSLSSLATEVIPTRNNTGDEYFLNGSSIPPAMHRKPFMPSKTIEGKSSSQKTKVQISGDVVIIAIVGGQIRTVYTENFFGVISFSPGFIKVLKPEDGVSAKYLAALISTKIVSDQIKSQCNQLTIPRLNNLDLSQIIVPDSNSETERQQVISDVISSEMSELETELQETLDKQKREVRSTRHAMIQTLSALSSNWGQLKRFAERKDGHINLSDTIGRINPITVELLMGSIGHAISTLERQVESLRFEKADWGKEVGINPYKFINDYIASHSTPDVRMVNLGDNKTGLFYFNFDEEGNASDTYHEDEAMAFYAPERLVERIFNNIVANAKAHGFSPDSTNNEIRFDWQTVNGNIVITIANNGAPLKDGVTSDDVLMSGFSTALNENAADGTLHSGQGGFEIKSLMETFGKVEVVSEPDAEYPVMYKLTFEKTNFVTLHE